MKATDAKLLDFMKNSPQFIIPIYQRTYSWEERECRQLWNDIIKAGSNDTVSAHFVGSIVYIAKGLYAVMNTPSLLVIDGQQRLTTIALLIEALARAVGETEPIEGFSAKKLRNYYLLNPLEEGERKYKIILSQTDKTSLISIVEQGELPKEFSFRVSQNFSFFEKWIQETNNAVEIICKGLSKLMIVDISLHRDLDNPQLIFESLNSTGKELSQADLIRNYILMGLEPQLQTSLYEKYWRPMEIEFGQQAYTNNFDGFMRHYLTVKTGSIPNIRQVYEEFKIYAGIQNLKNEGVEGLVSDIRSFSHYYCAIALGEETNLELKNAFHDLRELKVDVAYPLLLESYSDYSKKILSPEDFEKIIRLIEAYVFRRSVCSIPTSSMNKTFATFAKSIDKNKYLESVQAVFLLLPSYRRFPRDDEFKREVRTRNLYKFRNCSYWLRRLENYDRKERIRVEEYTIEHIMPQNENLSSAWKQSLGSEWERIHETYLHTLGNLTLTGYNSEYSDKSFIEKRDIDGGFKESPLKLNKGLGALSDWNEAAIINRADILSNTILAVWTFPKLDDNILEQYKPRKAAGKYTIEDHPNLLTEPLHSVFNELRKSVLALDPCVKEEFLKIYVAYKAETNFVDIIPQSKKLLLSLNIDFLEIDDPKGLCKDVSNTGWGNGDVEISLSKTEELPYVLGLVRQAFEKQMGNGDME